MVSPTSASLDDVAIGPSAVEPLPQVVDSELETKVRENRASYLVG